MTSGPVRCGQAGTSWHGPVETQVPPANIKIYPPLPQKLFNTPPPPPKRIKTMHCSLDADGALLKPFNATASRRSWSIRFTELNGTFQNVEYTEA